MALVLANAGIVVAGPQSTSRVDCWSCLEPTIVEQLSNVVDSGSILLPVLSIRGLGSEDRLDRLAAQLVSEVMVDHCLPVASAEDLLRIREVDADVTVLFGADVAATREALRHSLGDIEVKVSIDATCSEPQSVYGLETSSATGEVRISMIRTSNGSLFSQTSSVSVVRRIGPEDAVVEAVSNAARAAALECAEQLIRHLAWSSSRTTIVLTDLRGGRYERVERFVGPMTAALGHRYDVQIDDPSGTIVVLPPIEAGQLAAVADMLDAELVSRSFDGWTLAIDPGPIDRRATLLTLAGLLVVLCPFGAWWWIKRRAHPMR